MTYSTFIHSGLVNPAKPKIVTAEAEDAIDTVTMDIPLLTRLLELSREDIKDDAGLHHVLERILALKNEGTLTMQHYDTIAGTPTKKDADSAELESIKKLAGI